MDRWVFRAVRWLLVLVVLAVASVCVRADDAVCVRADDAVCVRADDAVFVRADGAVRARADGAVRARADGNEFFDPEGYTDIITYSDWTTNTYGGEALVSTSVFGGTVWETYGFTRKGVNDKPATGYADLVITATVKSQSAVTAGEIGRIAVNVASDGNRNDLDTYAPDIRLIAGADNASMTPCGCMVRQSAVGRYYIFDVPASETPLFFRIEFEVPKSRNGWLQLHEILFYRPAPPVDIKFDKAAGECSLVSNNGDLHLLASEYDALGNPVGRVAIQPGPARAEDSDLWTNKVADEGVPYKVTAPATPGNYLDMRIKTVKDGVHSPETRYMLTGEGLITAVQGLTPDDASAPVQWYDMTGRPIPTPAPGLNIRLQGTRATKILL